MKRSNEMDNKELIERLKNILNAPYYLGESIFISKGETDRFISLLEKEEREKWISVKDRLPDFETVIVAVGEIEDMPARIDVAFYNARNKGWGSFALYDWAGGTITHWMPFPELPKPEDSK
jgi:hypothetical protein